ncbi:MAG: hypothetical protein ACI4JB_08335 [Porcipelethomonas sp.]
MNIELVDNRIFGNPGSAQQAAAVGLAASGCAGKIAVGKGTGSRAAEYALISGIISGGADAVWLGECLETELFFASEMTGCEMCLYITDDPLMKIDVRSMGGIMLTADEKDKLSCQLSSMQNEKMQNEGGIIDCRGLRTVYRDKIKKLFPDRCPYSVFVSCSGSGGQKLHFSGTEGEEIVISLSSDGTKSSVYSEESGFVSMEELIFICCLEQLEQGNDIAVPFSFPHTADKFAEDYGRKAYRYYNSSDGEADRYARELALRQKFTLDGLYLAANAIRIITEEKTDLVNIRKRIPQFYQSRKFIELEKEKTDSFFRNFTERTTPDGAVFVKNNSRIVVQRSLSGGGLWLSAESRSMEAAAELCAGAAEKLKSVSVK